MVAKSTETWGISALILHGWIVTVILAFSRVLQEWEWPYFCMMALSTLMVSAGIGFGLVVAQSKLPEVKVWKWILGRSLFGTAAFVLQILAYRVGADAGDVASLTSVNTVAAALLGRAFLGEELRLIHGFSLCFTIGGAFLIAQPSFIFGQGSSDAAPAPAIGLILSLLSGFAYAGGFICSRKAAGASPWLVTMAVTFTTSLALAALPFTPLVDDFLLAAPLQNVGFASAVCGALLLMNGTGWLLLCAGAMWCPAAISALTNLTSRMVAGYLSQTLLFGQAPTLVKLLGAASMLAGVAIVLLPKVQLFQQQSPGDAQSEVDQVVPGTEEAGSAAASSTIDDETESLASFIASEYVEFRQGSTPEAGLRRRTSDVRAETIGVAAVFSPASAHS